jgi:hypothetical protein
LPAVSDQRKLHGRSLKAPARTIEGMTLPTLFTGLSANTRRLAAVGLVLGTVATLPVAAAEANHYYTESGAERIAKDFVSKHYADTYVGDLDATCRPQGRRYDPDYKYHRWVCRWHDYSDGTSGSVLIVGSDAGPGAYYGRVLHGAH